MEIQEIIVVEGRDDTAAIQRAVKADTIETGGSALNQEIIERIRLAQSRRGVIIFTDPDYPGERIRKTIAEAIPGCKHAFLPRHEAKSKKGKIGVEHANPESIREALRGSRTEIHHAAQLESTESTVTWLQLQDYGLVGQPISQQLRAKLGEKLGIGYCNGKQLYKRLIAFRISQEEFERAYQEVKQEIAKNHDE